MYMSTESVPRGSSRYVLFIAPPTGNAWIEEIDVVIKTGSSVADIAAAAKGALSDYPDDTRVISIRNSHTGVTVAENLNGDVR